MRTLGIDFGERRIGLALSDPAGRFALPLKTLARTSDRAAIAALVEIVREHEVEAVAIGEPLAAGVATAAARRVRSFAGRLARATALPIVWIDETLTSAEAESRLREAGVPAARRAERRDQLAAQTILQEALDRRLRSDGW